MAGFKLVFFLVILVPLITAKTLSKRDIMQDMLAKIDKLEQKLEDVIESADEETQKYHDEGEGEGSHPTNSNAFQHVIDASGNNNGLHETDMKFTAKQEAIASGRIQGDLITNTNSYWDDKYTENGQELIKIPYILGSNLNEEARIAINQSIEEFTQKTCLRLQLRNNDADYIKFFKENGCWSYVGRTGGEQEISIGRGCEYKSTVVHEIMHAIGYFHEQSRQDRDQYIQVNLENVIDGYESQFDKQQTDNQGKVIFFTFPQTILICGHSPITATVQDINHVMRTDYDYDSVMHYGATAFSKNGDYTIQRVGGPAALKYTFGSDDGLSTIDAIAVNKIYCPNSPTVQPVTSTEVPGVSTSTEVPGVSTSTEGPGISTSTEVPGISTSTEVPGVSTSTEVPGVSTSTEVPGISTSTEVPVITTSTEQPEMSTTEEPEQSTTSEPEVSTTPDPSSCVQWPEDDGEFCGLVRRRGFCRFCSHNNHCADTCVDRRPAICERRLDNYYRRIGQTRPTEQEKRALRSGGKQNWRKKNRKHPCDRWWFIKNCAGSCAYHYCDDNDTA